MKHIAIAMILGIVLMSNIAMCQFTPWEEWVYSNVKFVRPTTTIVTPGGGGIGDIPPENITNVTEEEPDVLDKPVEEIFDEKIEEAKKWVTAQITGWASFIGINPKLFPIFIIGIIFLIFVLYEESKKRKDEDEI